MLNLIYRLIFSDIYVSQFSQNPYIRGSYSKGVVGSSEATILELGKNIGNLFFAGEATDKDWIGLMQGAYRTGESQAKMIASAIKCKETGKECPVPTKPPDKSHSTSLSPSMAAVFAGILITIICSSGGFLNRV